MWVRVAMTSYGYTLMTEQSGPRELVGHGVTTFVEVGPGSVLSGLLKRIDSSVQTLPVNDLASLDAATAKLG